MSTKTAFSKYRVKGVTYYAEYDQSLQHIPFHDEFAHLRPPKPRLTAKRDIFIGVASYRDGIKCGFTLWSAFARATYPEKVYFGIVDQTFEGDPICIEEYCKLARITWPKEDCKYKNQVRIDARSAKTSKGPTLSRSQQSALLREEEFCMMIDSHSQFIYKWDELLIEEWTLTDNEMAVLSNYPLAYNEMGKNYTASTKSAAHICNYLPRKSNKDIARYSGMNYAYNFEKPLLSVSWAGGFSFGKCHSWRRVPIDPFMNWVFWGEEFLHTYQLWSRGYDMYSPSRHGAAVFHNWTVNKDVKPRFWDNVTLVTSKKQHDKEEAMAYNRLRLIFRQPFTGEVDSREIDKYGGGKVRSLDQFLKFVNISNTDYTKDFAACNQVRFVPYQDPTELEELLPGWQFFDTAHQQPKNEPAVNETMLTTIEERLARVHQENENLLNSVGGVIADLAKKMTDADQALHNAMVDKMQKMLNAVVEKNEGTLGQFDSRMRQIEEHSIFNEFNEFFQLLPVLILILGAVLSVYCGRQRRLVEAFSK